MDLTFSTENTESITVELSAANRKFDSTYPGKPSARQPVHTVYGGAHLFKYNTAQKIGELAQKALSEHAPNPEDLSSAMGRKDTPEFS